MKNKRPRVQPQNQLQQQHNLIKNLLTIWPNLSPSQKLIFSIMSALAVGFIATVIYSPALFNRRQSNAVKPASNNLVPSTPPLNPPPQPQQLTVRKKPNKYKVFTVSTIYNCETNHYYLTPIPILKKFKSLFQFFSGPNTFSPADFLQTLKRLSPANQQKCLHSAWANAEIWIRYILSIDPPLELM